MIEVSMQELSLQDADMLPTREALDSNSFAFVHAVNVAIAEAEGDGDAIAKATQTIVVLQK
ncbi:MAG TPA: hypothetical protein VFG87_15555 [Amycolatopsis sp.]|jgi:hypothetical protein|nr:hypothetical protein [Amycolatopsis sp.]